MRPRTAGDIGVGRPFVVPPFHESALLSAFRHQSTDLLQAEPIYTSARRRALERGRPFRAAKLFWWFNQGADVAISVTPKPYYGADGNKVFRITGTPEGLCERLEASLGRFP